MPNSDYNKYMPNNYITLNFNIFVMEEESGSFPPDEESKSSLNISMSSG